MKDAVFSFALLFTVLILLPIKAMADYGYAKDFWNYSNPILNQHSNKSKLRNTCGAMSALILYNHATKGNPGFTNTAKDVENAITRLYCYVGKSTNQYFTNSDIKSILKNKWGWTEYTKSRSSYAGYNYTGLINDLKTNRPVIVLMKAGSDFEPVSTNGKRAGVEHFLVVCYASDNWVYYMDPWDGALKWATKAQFENGWVNTKIAIVGKPNLSGIYWKPQ